jgi:hypothetical protein
MIVNLFKNHLHIILYTYFWLGLFVCGLAAPDDRMAALGSRFITNGWQLSVMSVILVLPVPVVYVLRRKKARPGCA